MTCGSLEVFKFIHFFAIILGVSSQIFNPIESLHPAVENLPIIVVKKKKKKEWSKKSGKLCPR